MSNVAPAPLIDPALGDPSLLEAMRKQEIKGIVFESRRRYVEEKFGASVVDRWIAAMPPDAARAVRTPPLASSWQPFIWLVDVDVATIRDLFHNDPRKMADVAAAASRYEINALYRFVLKLASPGAVLKRLGVVLSSKLRPASLVDEVLARDHALLRLGEGVLPSYYCEHIMPAWAVTAISMTGAKHARCEQIECRHRGAAACRWRAEWR